MPASNVAQIFIAKQAVKGTPVLDTAAQWVMDVTDSSIGPNAEIEVREETGLGREPGDSYKSLLSAQGSFTVLLRESVAPCS